MYDVGIDPREIDCDGEKDISFSRQNIGMRDLDVELFVKNSQLNINEVQNFELDEGDKERRVFRIGLDNETRGTYRISIIAEYLGGTETATVDLTVNND